MSRWSLLLLVGCSMLDPQIGDLKADDSGAGDDYAGPTVSFARDIRPLMDRSDTDPTGHGCKFCHYSTETQHAGTAQVGLDLSTLGSLRKGGINTGSSIVVPGSPDDSAIVQKLKGTFRLGVRMPKSGPPYWSDDEIALVERWIAQGAPGADSE